MLWAYRGSFVSIYLGGRNYETRKGGINGAQRDPDRHDGWFQGSLTKDENLDRAQKIRPPDKSVHWKAIFSILILIQKTFAVGTQKNRLNETVPLSSLNTCLILVRRTYVVGTQKNHLTETVPFFLSFSIYCLALAFEHYRQVYIVHSGLQDESLQVTISKLP